MYKGHQFELFTNSWGLNSGFEKLSDELNDLIPPQGEVKYSQSKNKHLDKFRRAQNAAYDLFNNGLFNRKCEFKNIFGFAPTQKAVRNSNKDTWTYWEDMVEKVMTPIIQDAAKEQGVR